MSLFKNLFGKKDAPDVEQEGAREFDADWTRELRRFEIVTGALTLNLAIRQPKTGKALTPHEAAGETFVEWRQLETVPDRRRLLFNKFFSIVHDGLNSWQTANYATATGRANVALSLLEQCSPPEAAQEDFALHCAAFARALLALTRYPEALAWARRAADAASEDTCLQTILADALHLNGEGDEAHAIYARLLATVPPAQADEAGATREMFAALFARETGVIPSPVLAISIGKSLDNPQQAQEFWPRAEAEFYDSPYFRAHHAYQLAAEGKTQQSFERLVALVREMPWLKEASLNLLDYFQQTDPSGTEFMPEFQRELRANIERNGWSTEGMTEVRVGE